MTPAADLEVAATADHGVPAELLARIRAGRRFLLTSHVNPDGDAIGSELGLQRVLAALGKEARVWNRDPTPGSYRHLAGSDTIHVGDTPPSGFPGDFDAAIVLECPTLDRCGHEALVRGALPLINIDHHLGNDLYGVATWIDVEAPAVGSMVFRLARALGAEVDGATADCLYLALVTDTGNFRFANATAQAFESAANLVRAGARPEQVCHWLYESRPESALRLLGEMLPSLELHHGGRVATAWLTREMVQRSGARPGDSEGLVDYPRSIAGVVAVALFRELEDGRVKASLRSRGELSVERIARAGGGGGHTNAAGFTASAEASKNIQSTVVEALAEALDALDHQS
ncbi:MAG: bifunctional oligoribonuclease/PAP phosphatase NrnA [Holophagales bacterium]|nr:bifunctional oligoribonuclease/PAP phosphatase NrnA [Holophagales bacterium]